MFSACRIYPGCDSIPPSPLYFSPWSRHPCSQLQIIVTPELKTASKLVYRESHPLVLRYQTLLLKRAAASDPFLTIQIIGTLILNSLRLFVSSKIAHKSIIHLEGPDRLCWLQMVLLASVFLLKVHVTVKLSIETIENKWIIMWSSCFVL